MKRQLACAVFAMIFFFPLKSPAKSIAVEAPVICPELDFEGFSEHGAVGKCMKANCWNASRCADAVLGANSNAAKPVVGEMQTSPSCKLYFDLHKGSTCKGLSVVDCARANATRLPRGSDCSKLAAFERKSQPVQSATLIPSSTPPATAD